MCLAARRAPPHFSVRLGFLGLGKVPPSSREGRDWKGREREKKNKKPQHTVWSFAADRHQHNNFLAKSSFQSCAELLKHRKHCLSPWFSGALTFRGRLVVIFGMEF